MAKYFQLNDGHKMPALGMGTFGPTGDNEKDISVYLEALDLGYRHFDTAHAYRNEAILGTAIERWITSGMGKRDDLFIVTKLPGHGMSAERVPYFLKKQLAALKLSYVDMYLIHSPVGMQYTSDDKNFPMGEDGKPLFDMESDFVSVWKAMEQQVDDGLAKSIGISNFAISQVERLLKGARIPPANLQVELNAYFQQKPLLDAMKKHKIVITAYSALGTPGRADLFKRVAGLDSKECGLLEDGTVTRIAAKHSKLPSQVLLRFHYQKLINSIPRSTNPERLKQNIRIYDFELDKEDLEALEKLDKGLQGRGYSELYEKMLKGHPEYRVNEY